MLKKYITDLKREFRGYNGKTLSKDIFAGLTVAAVALPLALAFGVSSGTTAAAGLITAIVAGLVIGSLSGAYYQISGPTGAMAAILVSVVAQYRIEGVFLAMLISGLLLVLAGISHMGKLTAYIPTPVITGFTSGIAVIIALGQLDNFFGVKSAGTSAIGRLASYAAIGFAPSLQTAGIGLFVIGFVLLYPKKWNDVVPASLIGIVIATAFTFALGLDIQTVGEVPKTLFPSERLTLSDLSLGKLAALFPPAVSIALLGMIESLMCGSSAGRMTGARLDSDRELVAQGIGNVVLPFFGGIPATAAIARTSVAIKSGAQTRLTGIFHAVGLLVSLLLLGPVMSEIPLAALAGVLMVTAWRMNEWESIRYIFSHKFKGPILKFLATMISTIVFDLTAAILIGVALALVLLAIRLARIEINYEKVDMSRVGATDEQLLVRYGNTCVIYINGPLLFANARNIEAIPSRIGQGYDTVLLSMRGVSHIDITGIQALSGVLEELGARGIDFALCGVSNTAMETMRRSGIFDLIGEDRFYWSVDRALLHNRPVLRKQVGEAGI